MTDSSRTPADAVAADADRIYDSYSDRDDNSSIAPFPPYRERDAGDDGNDDEVVEQVVDTCGPADAGIDIDAEQSDALPTPTPAAAAAAAAGDSSAGRVRLFSDAAQPAPPTTPATPAVDTPIADPIEQPPKPPSPQPAPPPPYWTHSRDSSSSRIPRQGQTVPTEPAPSSPLPSSSTPSAPKANPKPKTKPKGLSLFVRPTGSRSATSNGTRSNKHPGPGQNLGQRQAQNQAQNHRRDTSSSTLDFHASLITLQDNEAEDASMTNLASQVSPSNPSDTATTSNTSNAWLFGRDEPPPPSTSPKHKPRCWARRVDIVDHAVLNGGGGSSILNLNHPRIGAFVVWTVQVETLATATAPAAKFYIHKRYSEFDALRRRLVASFPQARGGGALPPLPPKSVLGKFQATFLEQRRLGLQYFLNCILLNPEFAGSSIVREFMFG